MMQALLLSLTGQSRVAPQTHQQHVRQPYMYEPYIQPDSHGRMPSRSKTPYMPHQATRPDPLVANQSQPRGKIVRIRPDPLPVTSDFMITFLSSGA